MQVAIVSVTLVLSGLVVSEGCSEGSCPIGSPGARFLPCSLRWSTLTFRTFPAEPRSRVARQPASAAAASADPALTQRFPPRTGSDAPCSFLSSISIVPARLSLGWCRESARVPESQVEGAPVFIELSESHPDPRIVVQISESDLKILTALAKFWRDS